MRGLAALALLCACSAAAQEAQLATGVDLPDAGVVTASWLAFSGLKVLPEEVYRSVLHLGPEAGPDEATAQEVQVQLETFLHGAGYELATVDARVQPAFGVIAVEIDEGALEKVVFQGRQDFNTIRFKLALDIPHDVFNRPELERQVAKLAELYGLKDLRMVLVASSTVKHVGPQLTEIPEMPDLKGFEILHALRRFELHFVLPDTDWDTGLGLDLRAGYLNSVELGGNYQGRGGFFRDDRWRIAAAGGVGLRSHIVTDAFFVHFSRAQGEGEYLFPAIAGKLRPALIAQYELFSQLRKDLNLVDYYASTSQAAFSFEWEPKKAIRFQFGFGVFDRRIFGLLPAADQTDYPLVKGVHSEGGTRPYGFLRFDFTFDPENDRWDRRHILQAQFQQALPGVGTGALAWIRLYYQWVRALGWHDFWLRARGYAVWYDVSFHDEQSLSEHLHGAFGRDYVRRAGSINTEFRFSITRDVLKLSVFGEAVLFTAVDRERDLGPVRIATAVGPGLHLLLEGMFQLDVYLAFGIKPRFTPADAANDVLSVAASLNLGKAF